MSAPNVPADRSRSIVPAEGARRNSVAGGASITLAWRLVDRLVSLVSTPVLARLLTPEDFGLIAMASLAAGIVAVFFDLGVNAALIQQRNPEPEHYDAAWSLRLMQACLVGAFVFAISWPAASYFNDQRLVTVIQVVSVTTALAGLENIGIVLFQKHFDFRREFRYFLIRRLLTFSITMSLALAIHSYWAVIFGALTGQIVSILLSYRMQAFRPRFNLGRLRDILAFSQWVLVRGVGGYVSGSLPAFVLGRTSGAAQLGAYSAAGELASLSAGEILAPLARVLYPALVEAREAADELRRTVALALSVQFMLTIPASIGLALVADSAIAVLLGPQWTAAVPLLQVLALAGTFVVFRHTGGYVLMAVGKIRIQAVMAWVETLTFALLAAAFIAHVDALSIAMLRVATVTVIAWTFAALMMMAPVGMPWRSMLGSFARPAIACGVMALVLLAIDRMTLGGPLVVLVTKVGSGALIYALTVAAHWTLAGKPDGAEQFFLEKMRGLFVAFRRMRAR